MSKEPYEEYPIDAAVLKMRREGVSALSLPELKAALKADLSMLNDHERAAAEHALAKHEPG